jgi:hypothetical protein
MTKGATEGVCIRANDLYNNCFQAGSWDHRPNIGTPYLAFIASQGIDKNNCMTPVPWKHVGIFSNGHIYHHAGQGIHGKVYKHKHDAWLAWMNYPHGTEMFFGVLP